jgi:hypothetical protein
MLLTQIIHFRILSDPDKRCEYDRNGFTSADFEKPCVKVQVGVVVFKENYVRHDASKLFI